VIATETADIVRLSGAVSDMPAAYAAATVVVSAAVQPEGLQRALLEAQAMERPVIVSELGAGADVVLAPPTVPHDRITGLRFATGDDSALAAALIQLFSLPESAQRAIGARGRAWAIEHFNAAAVSEMTLKLYNDVVAQRTAA
jgi:glycosyltransferase involved in cell wall biosynthesis